MSVSATGPSVEFRDEGVLAQLRAHDPVVTERFVREQTPRALSVARRLLGNEADGQDVVQEAFLSFFRSLGDFSGQARLSTWFYRIVVNAALMRRRSKHRSRVRPIEDLLPRFQEDGHTVEPPSTWPDPSALTVREETRRRVRALIDELPDEFRTVILLRDIEEMDTAQTAELLGDSPGAIKTRLHRARQALRTLLERELKL